jgi:hypothetical protein
MRWRMSDDSVIGLEGYSGYYSLHWTSEYLPFASLERIVDVMGIPPVCEYKKGFLNGSSEVTAAKKVIELLRRDSGQQYHYDATWPDRNLTVAGSFSTPKLSIYPCEVAWLSAAQIDSAEATALAEATGTAGVREEIANFLKENLTYIIKFVMEV